jgi:hypothetical protein
MSSVHSFTESFTETLIGYSKDDTINAYYERDINMGLNNVNTIVKALKKLGYYETNINSLEEAFIKSELTKKIKNNSISNLYYVAITPFSLKNGTHILNKVKKK